MNLKFNRYNISHVGFTEDQNKEFQQFIDNIQKEESKIETPQQHQEALSRISELLFVTSEDPEYQELLDLVDKVEQYEEIHFPISYSGDSLETNL